jgi:outer membrane lipopolysaccharide assembly protein LptE/RlpB
MNCNPTRGADHRFQWSARLRSSRFLSERKLSRPIVALILLALTLASCGYHLAGSTSNLLPKGVQTIAIPAFANITINYKLTDALTQAMTREFISRTKYTITSDPRTADATLHGTITQIFSFPTVYDPVTFRATDTEVHVNIRIQLVDKSGKVLFDRPGMEVRERYEISTDPVTYFDENEFAMRRLSQDVAKTIVSAILENF